MDKKSVSFSSALEGYFIAAHARRLSPHTLTDYNNTFRKFEAFLDGDPPLASLTVADIRAFLNSLDGLSAKSVANAHIALSALWTWARKEGLVDQHIVRQIECPRPDQPEILPYTERDVRAMIAACNRSQPYSRSGKRVSTHSRPTALRDQAILRLLLDTGMRASELCGLHRNDLDLKNHRLTVMGKGRKQRVLPIGPRTAQGLWRYLATRDDPRPNPALFISRTGRPITRRALYSMVRRTGVRAGVIGATVHRFRHTFAINYLRNGGHVFALQRSLGHTSLKIVNRYLRIAQVDLEAAHRIASPVENWGL
jgi:site-specific recombinase XerD